MIVLSAYRSAVLRTLFLTLLACICAFANALPITYGWTRSYDTPGYSTYQSSIAQDVFARSYSLFRRGSGAPGVVIGLRSYDIDGSLRFSKTVLSTSIDANAGDVAVSKVVSGSQFIYVSCRYRDASLHWHTYYAKYDTAGNFKWGHTVSGGTGISYPLAIDTDSSGNAYFASASSSPSWHLDIRKLSPTGVMSVHKTNFRIAPFTLTPRAYHVDNRWIVSGGDNLASGSSMWAVFDDTTGVIQGFRTFTDHSDATSHYHYVVWAKPYNGGVLSLFNVAVTPVGGGAAVDKYLFSHTSYAGALDWSSTWKPGFVSDCKPGIGVGPSYASGVSDVGSVPFLQRINNLGAVAWTKNLPVYLSQLFLASDVNGCFVASWDTRAPIKAVLYRYDSAGNLVYGVMPPGGQVTDIVTDGRNAFVATQGVTAGPKGAVLSRYFLGTCLSSITTSNETPASAENVTLTIHLNEVAASGVSVNLHTTSSNLLFSNATQNITVTVPAGQSSATVVAQVQVIDPDEPVDVIATFNGIKRAVHMTMVP